MRKTPPAIRIGSEGVVLLIAITLLLYSTRASRAADNARMETNGFRFVDLSPFASSAEGSIRQFSVLPTGWQNFHGVPFLVGARLAVTGIESATYGEFFPAEVTGIKIGGPAKRIHLLHATMFAEKDGVPLAKVVFRYAQGGQESVRLGYGVHARAWITPRREKKTELFDPNSQLAWSELDERRGTSVRIFQTALENPRPAEAVVSIDVVSLFSHAASFISAISVETPESNRPANRPLPSRKPVRDLQQFGDSTYRRELSVRVTDGPSGGPPPNAIVVLGVSDDKETYFFGETKPNAQGLCRMPYPVQHAVGINLWVHAPGRAPTIISESKTNRAAFSGDYVVTLKPGTTVGGIVKGVTGTPIAGAQVIIHKVTRLSPHHYGRVEFDVAVTGADGKWASPSLPEDLRGIGFQVSHPDYRSTLFVTAGYAPPPTNTSASSSATSPSSARLAETTPVRSTARSTTVPPRAATASPGPNISVLTTNALLTASAELTVPPSIVLEGTLVDAEGKPVPATEIIIQRPDLDRKYARTDAQGHFRTRVPEPGTATLMVLREGFSPVSRNVNVAANMASIEIKLAPPHVLRGRVQDRNGRPVSEARVKLDSWNNATDLLNFQALTDAQGTFVWTGAPMDQVSFYVSKTNYLNHRSSVPAQTGQATLILNRPPGVYGKVFDAETRQPIDSFTVIPGRKYSSSDAQIHWERSYAMRGRQGEYSLKMDSYLFQPEGRVVIEAMGYEPQVSPAFTNSASYAADFALKKGKGIRGVVQWADGTPVPGAALVLAERGEYAYLESGRLRANSSSGDMIYAEASGRFEFPAKLEPDKIFVSHEQGFAQSTVSNVVQSGKIVLERWGRVTGRMLVGDTLDFKQWLRLQTLYDRYADASARPSRLSFSSKAEFNGDRSFVFDKVVPGEHQISLEYQLGANRNGGETPLSHGFPVVVKPGETTDVAVGGTGRQVTGRVKVVGSDPSDVAWRRDVHKLSLALPNPVPPPTNVSSLRPAEQQRAWNDYNQRQREFWQSEAGRAHQRAERTYVLLFDSEGNFRADHVPPGPYHLTLNFTDPDEEYYNRRSIGSLSQEIVVPNEKDAQVNAPWDIGLVEVAIRSRLRIGRQVPAFEAKTADGKTIKLSDYRGKPLLLQFWGQSLGYSISDFQLLQQFQDSYVTAGQLAILGCNLDADTDSARQFVKNQNMTWTQTYLGAWNQTPIPGMFGLQGSGACFLIDAEGKLASNPMRGNSLRNALLSLFSNE
jgi:protocatechuate 3,4-dioxygenase beta subunit